MKAQFYAVRLVLAEPRVKYGFMGCQVYDVMDDSEFWIEKDRFDQFYRPVDALGFSAVIAALKDGQRVTREAWRDRLVYLVLADGSINRITAHAEPSPWIPTVEDLLAEDWRLWGKDK